MLRCTQLCVDKFRPIFYKYSFLQTISLPFAGYNLAFSLQSATISLKTLVTQILTSISSKIIELKVFNIVFLNYVIVCQHNSTLCSPKNTNTNFSTFSMFVFWCELNPISLKNGVIGDTVSELVYSI